MVTLRSFSKDFIDVDIQENVGSSIWRWTGFYGSPYIRDRGRTWDLLRTLGNHQNMPWLVSGDFNEILYAHDKKGGLPRDERGREEFRNVLEDCGLEDIGFSGPWFT